MNTEQKQVVCNVALSVMALLFMGWWIISDSVSQAQSREFGFYLENSIVYTIILTFFWYANLSFFWYRDSLADSIRRACLCEGGYLAISVFWVWIAQSILSKSLFILSAFYLGVYILPSIISLFVGRSRKAGEAAGS